MADHIGVRIVVIGDRGTGKSSLIATADTRIFRKVVSSVLPPAHFYPYYAPGEIATLIDTSSSFEDRGKVEEELKRAEAVMLTYVCDHHDTINRLSTFWLPEIRRLEVRVPVILVGCKKDLRDDLQEKGQNEVMTPIQELVRHLNKVMTPINQYKEIVSCFNEAMTPIMQEYKEIVSSYECSAARHIQVPQVFSFAYRDVLYPPLYDVQLRSLKPKCLRALKRIFILCDLDGDGALNDDEFDEYQEKCFNIVTSREELRDIKRAITIKMPSGINSLGFTLKGFQIIHALYIELDHTETRWCVLRKFGYNDDIKLRDDLLPVPSRPAPDQSTELTVKAIDFLRATFSVFDSNEAGALQEHELEQLFSTAPESPWAEFPYNDSSEKTALGALTLNGFLSQWALMTLQDPALSLANLIYLGYTDDPTSALAVTRKRSIDRRERQQTGRNVFNCFVFGPKRAGKTALLDSFIGRPFSEHYSTTEERYATNIVDLGGAKKTLILREIPEDRVNTLLSHKEALATCDLALFVYDSSDEQSWKRAIELLVDVAGKGEITGFGVPCLLIPSKNDLRSCPMALQDSPMVCRDMGIEAPIPVSFKSGEFNNVFKRIINAAERPYLSVPETKNGRIRRQTVNLMMIVSVGIAAAVAGLAAYRDYSARKNT